MKLRYTGSQAEPWSQQFDAADFLNQAMLLAAALLLCVVPFFLMVTALAGRLAASDLSRCCGPSERAGPDLGALIASSSATSSAVIGRSWIFFVLGGVAGATAIQQLHQPARGARVVPWAVARTALVVGAMSLASEAGPVLRLSGSVLFWSVGCLAVTGLFWFSMWFLLAGGLPWRRRLSWAVARGTCWTGLILGAAPGLVRTDPDLSFRGALTMLRRKP
jgi:membrane protein